MKDQPHDKEVQAILDQGYPSYQEPVRRLWAWNRDGSRPSLQKAEELARALKQRYPDVLAVRFELAFSLVRQGRRPEALRVLEEAGKEFPALDEDTLSLAGRCHKDEGDALLPQELLAAAEREYAAAEEYYAKAYDLRKDRFPGINIAGLRLIRASLLCQIAKKDPNQAEKLGRQMEDLRRLSEAMAQELLAGRNSWKERLPDDNIWIDATEAEALLLLQQWDQAGKLYGRALSHPNVQPFHPESMKAQVVRLNAAFGRLGIAPQGLLAEPDKFFDQPKAAAPLEPRSP
jgi:hypothetical protein